MRSNIELVVPNERIHDLNAKEIAFTTFKPFNP